MALKITSTLQQNDVDVEKSIKLVLAQNFVTEGESTDTVSMSRLTETHFLSLDNSSFVIAVIEAGNKAGKA